MVQYREHGLITALSTTYWKLPRQKSGAATKRFPEDNGVAFTKTSSVTRLEDLNSRYQRGLLCYDKLQTTELLEFCKARNLLLPQNKNKSPSRADLLSTLESADKAKTFNRFMDLPPELRVIIYTLHLKSLAPPTDRIPTQPPLLKVSRLTRRESLPLFYNICDFRMDISSLRPGRPRFVEPENVRFIAAAGVKSYPQGLHGSSVPLGHLLKRLHIRTYGTYHSSGRRHEVRYEVRYELRNGALEVDVERTWAEEGFETSEADAEMLRCAERVVGVLRGRGGANGDGEEEAPKGVDSEGRQAGIGEGIDSQQMPAIVGDEKPQNDEDRAGDEKQCSKLVLENTDLDVIKSLSFSL